MKNLRSDIFSSISGIRSVCSNSIMFSRAKVRHRIMNKIRNNINNIRTDVTNQILYTFSDSQK